MEKYVIGDEDSFRILTWHFHQNDPSQSAVILKPIANQLETLTVVQNANDALLYEPKFRLH